MNNEQSPALRQAVENMANMREAYDNLSQAAEAYNTGKVQLAQNITAKGVTASASETLPELAEKVSAITQDIIEIDGGEMYAKQLYGSLEAPNYWNLYEVLTQLLSDGRLVNYGGILLAEYYKGYDSLALSGAGAGGAYVVSDIENGQFKMYTEDTTHTWATEFDGKGNRWVAYCFADEYHDFQITDTNTCPRSIFIGRKVGTITSLVNARTAAIVVPDGNALRCFDRGTTTQNFGKNVIIRNLENQIAGLFYGDTTVENVYVNADKIGDGDANFAESCGNMNTIVLDANDVNFGIHSMSAANIIIKSPKIRGAYDNTMFVYNSNAQYVYLIAEDVNFALSRSNSFSGLFYVDYISNDKTKSVIFGIKNNMRPTSTDFILQNGWCKPLSITPFNQLTEENMYAHILQRLKQDEPDCGDGVTITLGSTNLAKLTSAESVQLLDDLTNIYGYTFA